MKKDLDAWSVYVEKENFECALSRFLIAFEEFRAHLAPSRYPNIEINDEDICCSTLIPLKELLKFSAFPSFSLIGYCSYCLMLL